MHPIWSGSLSFGLINIPVHLYSASKERALKFKLLDRHGLCPISYVRVCRVNHKEVPFTDIVKGYEYKKGDYVVLTDKDFKSVAPRRSETIDIVHFTSEPEIDAEYFDKPYYLEPDKKAEKAYVLLREALKRSGKVGIARFVMKDKEHIAAIKPEGNALMLIQLRFQDEIRPPKELKIPKTTAYSAKELTMALNLIKQFESHFKAAEYEDTFTEKIEKLVKTRAQGKKSALPTTTKPLHNTEMRDLMKMLKKSLEKEKVRR